MNNTAENKTVSEEPATRKLIDTDDLRRRRQIVLGDLKKAKEQMGILLNSTLPRQADDYRIALLRAKVAKAEMHLYMVESAFAELLSLVKEMEDA